MKKYKRKPLIIEAAQWFPGGEHIPGTCNCEDVEIYHVHTLEGTSYTLGAGDWVIKGVKGEFYPCKPAIFKLIYEEVSEQEG